MSKSRLFGVVLLSIVALAAVGEPRAGSSPVWLTAEDGVEVRGDLYALEGDAEKKAPLILLFHQAGSNRGEYAEIATRLNGLGFHALAIDQRSGGTKWGEENQTVAKLGESTDYMAALPDLEAALGWRSSAGYEGKTLVWGSSYSASLVFLLAAEHDLIDGVLSFSPGEYFDSKDEVREAAARVAKPVFVATPANERGRAKQIALAVPRDDTQFVIPRQAVHGSSMLVPERNPGAEEIWTAVEAFLEGVR